MASLEFRNVGKAFGSGPAVISALDLRVEDGEFMVLVGPSGSGKSTVLRLLAGLEAPSAGEIRIGDRRVDGLPPQARDIAMVFQNYALYPHMTVARNLEFPLRMSGMPAAQRRERVARTAEILGLTPLLERKPRQLSGGQRQRVAMGRAMVRDPAAFLMDEPLSNLDAALRGRIRSEIGALQRRLGTTTLYVTHDQLEAMTLGGRIAVLRAGRVQQVATPREIYAAPANIFVAGFIGSPGMNIFAARIGQGPQALYAELGADIRVPLSPAITARFPALRDLAGGEVLAGIRPEDLVLTPAGDTTLAATVVSVEAPGHETVVQFDAEPDCLATGDDGLASSSTGSQPAALLTATLRGYHSLRPGERVRLGIAPQHLYFFAPSGESLAVTAQHWR